MVVSVLWNGRVCAQRLQVTLPHVNGIPTQIIYGRLDERAIWVFETAQPWPEESSSAAVGLESQRQETKPDQKTGSVGARFELRRDEREACQNSPRVRGFLQLLGALKQIASLSMSYGADWEPCAEALEKTLARFSYPLTIVEADTDEVLTITTVMTAPPPTQAEPRAETAAAAVASRHRQDVIVTIDGQQVNVDDGGWFIYLAQGIREHVLVARTQDKILVSLPVYPVPLNERLVAVAGSKLYSERLGVFDQSQLGIGIVAIPAVDKKHIVDAGAGLGFGYGREIPGEERGERAMMQTGFESREVVGPFGVKLLGSYTSASDSVVPWTVTGRALAFYDHSIAAGRMLLRLGGGAEYFRAKIRAVGGSLRTVEDVYIPEQVTAPLTLVGLQSVLFDWLVLGVNGYYTPLYVTQAHKFYPSYNVTFECGVKLPHDWLVTLTSGSETHRYPGLERDTRLSIDASVLSFRKGLF